MRAITGPRHARSDTIAAMSNARKAPVLEAHNHHHHHYHYHPRFVTSAPGYMRVIDGDLRGAEPENVGGR